jgi:hypothetical protein
MRKHFGYVYHTRSDGLQTVYRTFNRKAADLLVRRLEGSERITAHEATVVLAKGQGVVMYRDVVHGDTLLEKGTADD